MKTIFIPGIRNRSRAYTIHLLILMLSFSSGLFAQLSGTYTIGTGGDYTTFQAAADSLHSQGVSGPVVFNVLSGTYTGQFTLDYVPHANADSSITFKSQSGDSTKVVLKYDAAGDADNFLITLKRCSYVTLRGMTFWALDKTYSRIVTIEDYADHLTIENCVFKGTYNTNAVARGAHIQSEDAQITHLVIRNNWFRHASYGILINSYSKNNLYPEIIYNRFDSTGYCAVSLYISQAPVVSFNTIKYAGYGIYLSTAVNASVIHSNKLTHISYTGMYLSNMKSASGYEAEVSNNMVAVDPTGPYGMVVRNSYFINLYFNTVLVTQDYFQTRALSLEYNTGTSMKVMNNNIVALNNGYAIYVNSSGNFGRCDYNNFYTPGRVFAYWNDRGACEDFRTMKEASQDNEHSVFAFPYFISETDLHARSAWLDGVGIKVDAIQEDIDGNGRNDPPDIGCYEFTASPDVKPPLSGIITIGAGKNYASLGEAILDAEIKGVSDTLRLQMAKGTYEEQCVITPVAGASSLHPVILESASGNRDDVHIRYQAGSGDDNYVLKLKGSSFLHIRNLTMEATGSKYSKVIVLRGMVDSLHVGSCVISGTPQSDANRDARLVFSNYLNFHNMSFRDNAFINGSTSLIFNLTQPTTLPGELILSGNTFPENGYQSVYLYKIESPVISNNNIRGDYGIYIGIASQKLLINNNYIRTEYGGGLRLNTCSLPYDQYGQIYNNFIVCDGTSPNEDVMELINCEQMNIYYNSVSSFSNTYKCRPFNIYQARETRVINNIFSNQGTEYAVYVKASTFNSFDYNCFYSEGNNLGYWDQDCADLEAIKTASGMNSHSIFANPAFVSDTDLHVTAVALDSAAVPVGWITEDYDGDARDPQFPDIGADEFTWMPENHPPVAVNDTAEVYQGSGVDIEVLLNDSDPDNDSVFVLGTGTPAHGQITKIEDGVLTYLTPQSDFAGLDSVIYYISDDRGMEDSAWVFVYVLKTHFDIGFEFYDPEDNPLTRGKLLVVHRKEEGNLQSDHTLSMSVIGTNTSQVTDFPGGLVTASYSPDTVQYPELIKTYIGGTPFYLNAGWFNLQKDTSGVKIHVLRVHRIAGNSFITGVVINSYDSSALYGKWVFLIDNQGQIVKFDVTDDEGKFHFDSIPQGHYYFDGDFWTTPMDENNDSVIIEQDDQRYFIAGMLKDQKIKIEISNITGRKDLHATKGIMVYPNPVHDVLFLKFDEGTEDEVTIRFIGVDGAVYKTLRTERQPAGTLLKIPVSDLPPGLYILSVEGKRVSHKSRIVIMR